MRISLVLIAFALLGPAALAAAPIDGPGLKFFEDKIRPVLVKHCYECHSAVKQRGGLQLDSREGLLKGGESGPAIVPGKPKKSLLLNAVRHEGLMMPPERDKLSASIATDLEHWIEMGAPDPRDGNDNLVTPATWDEALAQRRTWWSLQTVRKSLRLPNFHGAVPNPVDRFLRAELKEKGLKPAGEADRRTLIRRLSFILTGLPPALDEVEAFVRDRAPDAYEKLVDRLLAAPHFGERWAQHWLDVVRFSETHGNEWNYEVQFAWRYRDYLIRALNDDVPYDQLVREHIAGDLLKAPRRNRQDGANESAIGTMFYRFGDGNVEDCAAVPLVAFDIVDNQIDTLSKAFQATTVACARCHDHKLDAVSMKDYYALVGILHSSRQVSFTLDGPETNASLMARLRESKAEIRKALGAIWAQEAADVGRYLLAAQAKFANEPNAVELALGLDPERLKNWVAVLTPPKESAPLKPPPKDRMPSASVVPEEDLFMAWKAATKAGVKDFAAEWRKQSAWFAQEENERVAFNRLHFRSFGDFRSGRWDGWQAGGMALRGEPTGPGDFALHHEGDHLVRSILPAGVFTHALSEKLNGTLCSPPLPREAGKKLSIQVLGKHHTTAAIVTHNCQLSDYDHRPVFEDRPTWFTFNLHEEPAALHNYLELTTKFDNPKFPDPIQKAVNKDKENYRVPWDKAAANPRSFFGVTRVVLHEGDDPPKPELSHFRPLFAVPAETPAEAATRYAQTIQCAVQAWAFNRATDDDVRWLDGCLKLGLLGNSTTLSPWLAELAKQNRALEADLSLPRVIHGLGDHGPGFDQPIFLRGDPAKPGPAVPRRYLEVLSKAGERFTTGGSGRLELAERIARPDNPFTARVMVNRLWQHTFGEGLVRTVDDFGHNGEQPSHPELLDYLSARFVEDGWSMKRLIRRLVTTQAFRQSNKPGEAEKNADPRNRLLHHFAPRRLEAEAIRDAILNASGRLERTLYGPSVDPFRDKEIDFQRLFSGPLDGNGRRSLYTKHTLMEAPKFLGAFNMPKAIVMQGRRDLTNVPAQALALLNDPFVLQQADYWAERLVARNDASPAERIDHMLRLCLGRPPGAEEKGQFAEAVRQFAEFHRVPAEKVMASQAVWKDFAHMLFNLKEFIYVP